MVNHKELSIQHRGHTLGETVLGIGQLLKGREGPVLRCPEISSNYLINKGSNEVTRRRPLRTGLLS